MKGIKTGAVILAFCCVFGLSPKAQADTWNQKTTVTFSGPFEVPGKVLPAGSYVFKLADSMSDREIVQVFNKRGDKVYGTFLTIPDLRLKPTGKTVLTFEERAEGAPQAVRAWFYPGDLYGHQFVYPKKQALALAKANNMPVPSMPDETDTTASNATNTLKQTPLKAEKPNQEETEVTEEFAPPPPNAASSSPSSLPSSLPKTASDLPLIGLIGLLSLGLAGSLRLAAVKWNNNER